MTKQTLPPHELTYLLTEELTKHKCCSTASMRAEIYFHGEDEEGCNWDVDILGDCNAQAEECDGRIQSALQVLRAKYNMERVD